MANVGRGFPEAGVHMVFGLSTRERLQKAFRTFEAALSTERFPIAVDALATALRLSDESASASDQEGARSAGDRLVTALRAKPSELCDFLPNIVDAALSIHAPDSAARWIRSAASELRGLAATSAPTQLGYVVFAINQTMSASTKVRLRLSNSSESADVRSAVVPPEDKIAIAQLSVELLEKISPDDVTLPPTLGQYASFLLNAGRAEDALPVARRACELAAKVLDVSDPLVSRLQRKLGEVAQELAGTNAASGVDAVFIPKDVIK